MTTPTVKGSITTILPQPNGERRGFARGDRLCDMKIALPVWQQRVSPVLDNAARFLVVTCERGREVLRKEFVMAPVQPDQLADRLEEMGVNVLLCAAVSQPLMRSLERCSVRVHPHLCGEADVLLRAFLEGDVNRSEFRMPGCWGWHVNGRCCRRHGRGRQRGVGHARGAGHGSQIENAS